MTSKVKKCPICNLELDSNGWCTFCSSLTFDNLKESVTPVAEQYRLGHAAAKKYEIKELPVISPFTGDLLDRCKVCGAIGIWNATKVCSTCIIEGAKILTLLRKQNINISKYINDLESNNQQ